MDTQAQAPAAPETAAPAAAAPAAAAAAPAPATLASDTLNNVKDAAANVSATLKNFSATNSGLTITIVVMGIAVAFATAYALYWMINKTMNNRSSYLLVESKVPILATQTRKLKGDNIPNSGNGKRASLSFWIYIHDINKFSGSYRHVLHRGKEDDTFDKGGPYVRLDKDTNKLSVVYPPNDTNNPYGPYTLDTTTLEDDKWIYVRQTRGITFDYIPLQRWVHVAVVVNEDANGGTITGYIDGELNKSVSQLSPNTDKVTFKIVAASPSTTPTSKEFMPTFDIQNANLDMKGDVYVGGSVNDLSGQGFSGLVGNIQFFNHDLNAQDVYDVYKKGPIDSLLARMGLPAYGVQSPVYRIA